MSDALRARLSRLEAAKGPRRGGCVVALPGETPEAAAARVAPRSGIICMPPIPDATTWERETVAAQRRLMLRAAVVAAGRPDPG